MKTIKYLLMIAAVTTIAFTACTQDADSPTLPTPESDERPISFAASMPVKAFGVESRAEGESQNFTLYYQLKDKNTLSSSVIEDVEKSQDGTYSFNALYEYQYGENDTDIEHRDLVWSLLQKQDDGKATFYLTATKDDVPYWATATVEAGETVTFGEMKPRKTRFTVQLTVEGNATLDENSFTFSLADVKDAEEQANNVTQQAWPTVTSNPSGYPLSAIYGQANKTYTATADFAPQMVGNLTISYGTTKSWEVNLAEIDVTGAGSNSKKANDWEAGEHITLKVKVTLNSLGTPTITVDGFTPDNGTHDFNGTVTTNP